MIFRRVCFSILFLVPICIILFSVFSVAWSTTNPPVISPLPSLPPSTNTSLLRIEYPYDNTVFPNDFVSPTFRWCDKKTVSKWRLEFIFSDEQPSLNILCGQNQWQPKRDVWADIKQRSLETPSELIIYSLDSDEREIKNRQVTFHFKTSADPVTAPIFYRDVILPFKTAVMKINELEWKLGHIASEIPPKTILTNLKACANCHSFPTDGSVLAMDVDYGNDKGSYIISPIDREVHLKREDIISWSDYRHEDGDKTFGLLSRISPDGRYILSTVKDRSVQLPANGIAYSQLFFPIQGILVVYDRHTKEMYSLPGADNPAFVQSNPEWSPNGKWIVFARAKADEYVDIKKKYIDNKKKICYDLYRMPFNEGRGGTAIPLEGASLNQKSNFFPKYSPDGKWIVFCQADSYMLLQEDSLMYMMPADGGQPKRMFCNHQGTMNSWHSFSPNSKWLVFASKVNGPYTQLWLTHIDPFGIDSPPVLLENFIAENRAANIPEFVNIEEGKMQAIHQQIFKNKPKNKKDI